MPNDDLTELTHVAHAQSDRQRLLAAICTFGVINGGITAASGQELKQYVDLRQILMDGRWRLLAGQLLYRLIEPFEAEVLAAVVLGGDPVATAVMTVWPKDRAPIDQVLVRAEPKSHGLRRQIEGPNVRGRRVVVLEDTATTGGSIERAVWALQDAGAIVVAVAVVLNRGGPSTAARIQAAAAAPFAALFNLDDVLEGADYDR